MKKLLVGAVAALWMSLAATVAKAEPPAQAVPSRVEAMALLRSAHSTTEYHALALYFHQQQSELALQAQAEKQEWQRRSQNLVSLAAKYPRPVDSSRYRYEYFQSRADQAAQLAAHFDQLAIQ